MENLCPCGSSKNFDTCCAVIHHDIKKAFTAEDLMRSRYAAFVKGNGIYLNKSHHSSTRPSKKEAKEIENWAVSVHWIKLEVLNFTKGLKEDATGTVEFKAYFYENEEVQIIHENSYFEKENECWMYKAAL